jgi:hypothetical protein
VQLTQISDLNVLTQADLEIVDEVQAGGSDGAVVDMHCDHR